MSAIDLVEEYILLVSFLNRGLKAREKRIE